jgi:hypothetical protein
MKEPYDGSGEDRGMFRGRGACGRFKDFLATKGLLEAWYTFEDEREKEALRLWCDENGLKLVDEHAGM